MNKAVNVSEFRQLIERLENSFNVHRHACGNEAEFVGWMDSVTETVKILELTVCKTAKKEDNERKDVILGLVRRFINDYQHQQRKVKKMDNSNQDQAKKQFLNVFITTDFVSSEGEKRTRWTQVGVAFPHKEGEGFNIEITPGLSVSGSLVILPPKDDTKENG